MSTLDSAQRYYDAWNARDSKAIVATFAEGGTYEDPASGGTLRGEAIGEYAAGLLAAFPDLSFEIVSVAEAGDNAVAAQWIMKGTNSAPFMGGPPTNKTIALPGADFIAVEGDRVASVKGYFDQRTFVDQLGLQTTVQPFEIGPVQFGNSVRMNLGSPVKPGAMSLTWIVPRSAEDSESISGYSQKIMQEIDQNAGFLGMTTCAFGEKMFTMTAWTDADAPAKMMREGVHNEAMRSFFKGDLGAAAITSVWAPVRINGPHVRCTSCDQMSDSTKNEGKCNCGEVLPEAPPYG